MKIINTGISLLLKLDQSTIDELKRIPLPDNEGLTRLKDEDLHVTLIGIKDFKKFKGIWDNNKVENHLKNKTWTLINCRDDMDDVSIKDLWLKIEKEAIEDGKLEVFSHADIITRDEKKSAIVILAYSEIGRGLYKDIVDEACKCQGLENPSPKRLFHITIANNGGGSPFKSIGDITEKEHDNGIRYGRI